MAQLNIRIPKALEDDFETYKDRFNVSEICQAAISRELDFYRRQENAMTSKEKLVAQFKQQRQQSKDSFFQDGRAQGAEDMPTLPYDHIQLALQAFSEGWDADRLTAEAEFEHIADRYRDMEFLSSGFGHYVEGWLEGLNSAWAEIEDEVESD